MPLLYDDYFQFALEHRSRHGCGGYPFKDGRLLTVLCKATKAHSVLEVGTAVGYSAACLASASPEVVIDTIEMDAEHVRVAGVELAKWKLLSQVNILHGTSDKVLPTLRPAYDLVFFDGFEPSVNDLRHFDRLIAEDGLLVSTNLSWTNTAQGYLALLDSLGFVTHSLGDTALSVRLT